MAVGPVVSGLITCYIIMAVGPGVSGLITCYIIMAVGPGVSRLITCYIIMSVILLFYKRCSHAELKQLKYNTSSLCIQRY